VAERLRDLLSIEELTAEQIAFLLDESKPFQEFQRYPLKKLATLRGKTVGLAFFEASTRTRISFATAASRLGADTMNLQAESSSLKKGESLLDTARTLDAMKPDCIVMRHSSSGAADFVARHLEIPVINAGDGTHEHPTQALLDALTIRDRRGTMENLNITIIGDILHSRVARSNLHLLGKFGCRFTLCGPPMWLPREFECLGKHVRRSSRIEEALEGADVVIVLRVQQDSRVGDRSGCSRWPSILHSGAGYQRPCRAHGRALCHGCDRLGSRRCERIGPCCSLRMAG
jgi:aspartate carbamoyltransferase catalytic subunit